MRENCTYGSEGGEGEGLSLPLSAFGDNWATIEAHLRSGKNAVRRMHEWDYFDNLNSRLGAPVDDFATPGHYSRKMVRSMGRVSLMAVRASEMALLDAGLLDDPSIRDGRMGIAYGSSAGSVDPAQPQFTDHYFTGDYPTRLLDREIAEGGRDAKGGQLSLLVTA